MSGNLKIALGALGAALLGLGQALTRLSQRQLSLRIFTQRSGEAKLREASHLERI